MKQNKLIVAVAPDNDRRIEIMRRLIIDNGFAFTRTDAAKLIRGSVHAADVVGAYFVIADNFRFHESPITVQRLYQMAARGIFVLLGVKSLPRQYEFICEAHFE